MKKHAAIFMIFYLTEGRSLKRSREERLQRNRRNLHKKEHKAMNVEVSASLRTNWKPENVRELNSTSLLFFFILKILIFSELWTKTEESTLPGTARRGRTRSVHGPRL